MERLHTATIFLLRYGGMHPFKTTEGSDQLRISVGLLLWTVFLQLVNALSFVPYMIRYGTFDSLDTLISCVWNLSWGLTNILVPIHFLCQAKQITAVNRQIKKMILICSIQRLKLNIKCKLMILFMVVGKIIPITCSVLNPFTCRSSQFDTPITIIAFIIIDFYAFIVEAVTCFIFVVCLNILAEYFNLFDANLEELFNRMQIKRILVTPMEENNVTPTNPDLYPLDDNKSTFAQLSVHSLKTTDTLPNSYPTHDPKCSQLRTKSLRMRTNINSTQAHVNNANMLDFFRILEETHVSIFEVYEIYDVYESILGFPFLYFTFFYTITCCASVYTVLYGSHSDNGATCFIILILQCLILFLNFVLLTSVPRTLDGKVSNDNGELKYNSLYNNPIICINIIDNLLP